MASDANDAPRMAGDPRLLYVGVVKDAWRESDGGQSVGVVGGFGEFAVAPIEYTSSTPFAPATGSWSTARAMMAR